MEKKKRATKKINLEGISEEQFRETLEAANSDVLKIATRAQDRINKILTKFDVKCDLTLNYSVEEDNH